MSHYPTYPPTTHNHDPITSLEAEMRHTANGQRATNLATVKRDAIAHPGCVADEIASRTGIEIHEVRRRLSDLKDMGELSQGAPVKCNGRRVISWWPVREQGRLPL